MVLADSHGVPRVPCYSGIDNLKEIFGYETITLFGIIFQLFHLISKALAKIELLSFVYPSTLLNR